MNRFETKNKNSSASDTVQPKLKVGRRGDRYEQEADAMADKVMMMPESETIRMQPMDEEEEEMQMKPLNSFSARTGLTAGNSYAPEGISSMMHSDKGNYTTLPEKTARFMSKAFNTDLSNVKVHTDRQAVRMAEQLGAKAFTKGNEIFFNSGRYNPESAKGKHLLAHELTHVVQQTSGKNTPTVQKEDVEVTSPVLEKTVTQISNVEAGIHGRTLNLSEIRLARSVFRNSIDYSRVRLIPTRILQWRTVANNIRVPNDFNTKDSYMAETFIHEMTHVWQYQHHGTSYISKSLSDQIVGVIRTGDRNAAYEYTLKPGKSFFDYKVEQQAYIVQTYFNLTRERANKNTTSERRAEIDRELVPYKKLIAQMSSAMPQKEIDLMINEAAESSGDSGGNRLLLNQETTPEERRMTPVNPLLRIRF